MSETSATTAERLKLRPGDLVMSDFDGTITKRDTGWVVFDELELDGAWDWEYRWRDREISSMECLTGQWDLVNLAPDEMIALIDTLETDERFPEFVQRARGVGAEVVVASDGLSFYLDRIMERMGFEICEGDPDPDDPGECIARYVNKAELTPRGVKITFPHKNEDCEQCGNCKSGHLARLKLNYDRIIYIGDGYSDRCPAMQADIVFAKDHLAGLMDEKGIEYVPFETFGDIIEKTLA
ncbi:MAG: MtnX-like HAD-IB family phosphatase [Armatimonadota bacterium]